MPYCPVCRSEFEERISRCSRCDCELVEKLPEELLDINIKSLCKVKTSPEAYLIKGLLDPEGILVFIRPFEVVMYNGIVSDSEGSWGEIYVPSEDIEKARTILNDYLSGEPGEEEKVDQTEGDEIYGDEDEKEEL
ncbi:MAG TPA: DUF2007 domain-containing protein [Candidatus Eremiobacteraeota bacterium]|nr:MAG: hypothetical protein BWY64_01039 [bacterium ADurb.Bin363]HPZ09476.1 DUF2007 domain-containing protein [Candidatus Eremiobacteraeota bacterium]